MRFMNYGFHPHESGPTRLSSLPCYPRLLPMACGMAAFTSDRTSPSPLKQLALLRAHRSRGWRAKSSVLTPRASLTMLTWPGLFVFFYKSPVMLPFTRSVRTAPDCSCVTLVTFAPSMRSTMNQIDQQQQTNTFTNALRRC